MSPEAMSVAFMDWYNEQGLDGQLRDDEVKRLAEAFYAGAFYIVRSSLT